MWMYCCKDKDIVICEATDFMPQLHPKARQTAPFSHADGCPLYLSCEGVGPNFELWTCSEKINNPMGNSHEINMHKFRDSYVKLNKARDHLKHDIESETISPQSSFLHFSVRQWMDDGGRGERLSLARSVCGRNFFFLRSFHFSDPHSAIIAGERKKR